MHITVESNSRSSNENVLEEPELLWPVRPAAIDCWFRVNMGLVGNFLFTSVFLRQFFYVSFSRFSHFSRFGKDFENVVFFEGDRI